MKTSLEELRILIQESLAEYNTNIAGAANHAMHAFAVPDQPPTISTAAEVPPDPADMANAIVVAIKNLVHPVTDEDGQMTRRVEVQKSKRVLEDWVGHEDALNAAAKIAAETLISSLDVTGISHSKDAGTLGY